MADGKSEVRWAIMRDFEETLGSRQQAELLSIGVAPSDLWWINNVV